MPNRREKVAIYALPRVNSHSPMIIEKTFREKEKTSIILGVVVSSFRREREREREIGEKKTRRVIDTFRGHVARGRGIMQHPRDTATLIIRGTRYRARLAVSLINRGDP